MEKVKIFFNRGNSEALEGRINLWLSEMGDKIEITRVLQDASGQLDHQITITIFYKEK